MPVKKIFYDNQTYYFNKGKVLDEHFLQVTPAEATPILYEYYGEIDYRKLNESELIDFLKEIKDAELNTLCLTISLDCLNRNSEYLDSYIYPIISSCYRLMGKPQKSIDFYNAHRTEEICSRSPAMLTSLAAAYCDLKNYESSLYYARRAYAILKNAPQAEVSDEIKNVFGRLRSESNLLD